MIGDCIADREGVCIMAEGVVSVTTAESPPALGWNGYVFRPIILLATAYITLVIIHESAHALAAYALTRPRSGMNDIARLVRVAELDISRLTSGEAAPKDASGLGRPRPLRER